MKSLSRALLAPLTFLCATLALIGCRPDEPGHQAVPAPPVDAELQIQKVATDRDVPLRIRENLVAQLRGPAPHDATGLKQAARPSRPAGKGKGVAQ